MRAEGWSQSNLFDIDHSLQYAQYLQNNNFHDLAAQEYARLYRLVGTDSIYYKTLKSFRLSQKTDSILCWVEARYPSKPIAYAPIRYEYVRSLAQEQRYETLASAAFWPTDIDTLNRLKIKVFSLLMVQKYRQAKQLTLDNDTSLKGWQTLAEQGEKIRYKKVWLARSLSAIVPGSGKVYAGEWQDGLLSLLSIGVMGWQTHRGFRDKGLKSVYGWINGTMGLGFYLGNIYGAGRSVRLKNRQKQEKIAQKTKAIFDKTLESQL